MSSDGTALRHNALVYESKDEYLACAVPFLKAGIEAGEGAGVAHMKPGLAMMPEALGPEAAGVTFVDLSAAYTRPARTLADHYPVHADNLPGLTLGAAPLKDLRAVGLSGGAGDLRDQFTGALDDDEMREAHSLVLLRAANDIANNAMPHAGGIQEVRVERARG